MWQAANAAEMPAKFECDSKTITINLTLFARSYDNISYRILKLLCFNVKIPCDECRRGACHLVVIAVTTNLVPYHSCQSMAIYFEDHVPVDETDIIFSNELHWLDLMIGYLPNGSSNGHQGNMPYSAWDESLIEMGPLFWCWYFPNTSCYQDCPANRTAGVAHDVDCAWRWRHVRGTPFVWH